MQNRGLFSLILALFSVILGIALPVEKANAQVLYGSMVGTVTDASGASVAGASVVGTNGSTGQTREGTTDAAGRFVLTDVWPGSYSVKVSAVGFRTSLDENVTVTANNVTRVDAQLQLGSRTEQVTVSASATEIQTDKADVRVDITTDALINLPLVGFRNFQSLVNLVPGATPGVIGDSGQDMPERSLSSNVNGGQQYTDNTRVDGALDIQIFTSRHQLIVPPVETIETVNIVTGAYDAEQGMTGTAAVSVITKSGTNELHGSAFAYHNDQHLLARDFFANYKPKSIMNIDGGTVGGPIRKNKIFFFGSWEGTFQRLGSSGLYTVPTANQLNGDFSTYGTTIYDPNTGNSDGTGRTPFANAMVPQSRISPIMQAVQNLIPLPNLAGAVSNLNTSETQGLSRNNLDGKVNWVPTSSFTVFGKYSVMDARTTCGTALGAAGGTEASGGCDPINGHSLGQMVTLGSTWTISPRMVFDGTLGFS